MGSVPPVDSITISDQNTPVEMWTDATFVMPMLSSLLPNKRDLMRVTRCGLITRRVGQKKLPCVQRLAVKVSAGDESIGLIAAFILGGAAVSAAVARAPRPRIAVRYTHSSAPFFHTHM